MSDFPGTANAARFVGAITLVASIIQVLRLESYVIIYIE